MGKFKTIYKSLVAFGGYSFKITTNGKIVNYLIKTPSSSRYKISASESVEQFKIWSENVNLFDIYNNNPAKVSFRIDALQNCRENS
jgi:hypothetical protein